MKRCSIFFLFLTCLNATGQVNLVPNPSFEDTVNCPDNLAQITKTASWTTPTYGSPDYYNECSSGGVVDIPLNLAGFQNAYSGQAYSGLVVYCIDCNPTINYREYIQVELNEPLIPSKNYNIEFYLSLADSSIFAIEDIGVYFSQNSIQILDDGNIGVVPQFAYNGPFLTNKNGWDVIEGNYWASGGEKYIIIGNFKDNNINLFDFDSLDTQWHGAYYYIDDVSVVLDTTTGINEAEDRLFNVYPNPANSKVTFSYNLNQGEKGRIDIYSINGVLLKSWDLKSENMQLTTSTAELAAGVYFCRLVVDGKNEQTQKYIIIHD